MTQRALVVQTFGYGENGGVNRLCTLAAGGVETGSTPLNLRPLAVPGTVSELQSKFSSGSCTVELVLDDDRAGLRVNGSCVVTHHIMAFLADEPNVITPVGSNASGYTAIVGGQTQYVCPIGGRRQSAERSKTEAVVAHDCTWRAPQCLVMGNSLGAEGGEIVSMVNGNQGQQRIAVSEAGNRWFAGTGVDLLQAGDRIAYQITGLSASGYAELERPTSLLEHPTLTAAICGGYAPRINPGQIVYFPLGGRMSGWSDDEALAEHALPFDCMIHAQYSYVWRADGPISMSVTLRVDGQDTPLTVTHQGVGVQGTTGSVFVPKGSLVSTRVVGGGARGYIQSIAYACEEIIGDPPPPEPELSTYQELVDFIALSEVLQQVPVLEAPGTYSLDNNGTPVTVYVGA